jgi:TonB family protein
MTLRWFLPVLRLVAATVVLAPLAAPEAAASADSKQVAKLIQRAAVERDRGDHERAAELFAKADQAAGGGSLPAVAGLCQANLVLERWNAAIAVAERWIDLAGTPESRGAGQHCLGVALFHRSIEEGRRTSGGGAGEAPGDEPAGTASLRRAAEALRLAAAGVTENRHLTLLSLAETLARLGEHAEVLEVLDAYAAAAAAPDPLAGELRCWSERAVARHPWSPEPATAEPPRDGRVSTPPRKLYAPAPIHGERARRKGITGVIILSAIVDREGLVACVRVLRGIDAALDRATLETLKTWRFEPARLDGEPVETYYNLTVNFTGSG